MNPIEENYYREAKNWIDNNNSREGDKLDRIIFAISTAPFVISITLITGFRESTIAYSELLLTSWLFLAASLIVHIFSFIYVRERLVKLEEKLFECRKNNLFNEFNFFAEKWNIGNRGADWLNYFSIMFAIIGIIFLTYFASLNINHKKMTNEIKSVETKVDEEEVQKHAVGNNILLPIEEDSEDGNEKINCREDR